MRQGAQRLAFSSCANVTLLCKAQLGYLRFWSKLMLPFGLANSVSILVSSGLAVAAPADMDYSNDKSALEKHLTKTQKRASIYEIILMFSIAS